MRSNSLRILVGLALVGLLTGPVWADTSISLEQSDGTLTRLGGTGNALKNDMITLLACEVQASGTGTGWCAVRPRHWATYMATGSFTPVATPTDLITIIGSASKTIKVHSIRVTTTNTAAGSQEFRLIKRSTADTTGTFVAATAVPTDSVYVAATTIVGHYLANPGALGTAVGTINIARVKSEVAVPSAAWNIADSAYEMLPSVRNGFVVPTINLRGVAENLAVNFNSAVLVPGQTHTYVIVWSEMIAAEE